MKKYLLLLLSCASLFAQKEVNKTFYINELEFVDFELNHVFNVSVRTEKTNEVRIRAKSEGEFANYFMINAKEEKHKLFIKSTVDFAFVDKNDKLSAHKVQAIEIEITLPENLNVSFKSDLANLTLTGRYDYFGASLNSGNCFLNKPRNHIEINTVLGNISAVVNHAKIDANSRQGAIEIAELLPGKTTYLLKSIKGDIKVKKTE